MRRRRHSHEVIWVSFTGRPFSRWDKLRWTVVRHVPWRHIKATYGQPPRSRML